MILSGEIIYTYPEEEGLEDQSVGYTKT